MKVKTNLVGGILFSLVGVILWLLIPSQIADPIIATPGISVKLGPKIVIGIMTLGGLGLIFQSLILKKEKIIEIHFKDEKYALVIIAIMALYAFLVYFIGFLIATLIIIPLVLLAFKVKNILTYLILMAIGAGVYFLFTAVFNIGLPGIGGILW